MRDSKSDNKFIDMAILIKISYMCVCIKLIPTVNIIYNQYNL